MTLDVIVVALFTFGFAGFYFSRLMTDIVREDPRAQRHLLMGNVSFVSALAAFTLSPALIFFTINLPYVGFVAIVLWVLLLILLVVSRRDFLSRDD